MRVIAPVAVLMFAVAGWAQSLGDVARADRDRAKPHARRVFTNENLSDAAATTDTAPTREQSHEPLDPLHRELEGVRGVLHGICADPRTEGGRYLSNEDKKALDEVVKPLRARVLEFERIRKKYKSALAALDQDFEAKIVKTVNTGQPFTDADLQRVKSLRLDHDARRTALVQQGERELEGLKALQQELEKVGDECPAAAATVPD